MLYYNMSGGGSTAFFSSFFFWTISVLRACEDGGEKTTQYVPGRGLYTGGLAAVYEKPARNSKCRWDGPHVGALEAYSVLPARTLYVWGVAKRLRQRVLIPIREGSNPFVPGQ